jgi:hypothetical protein
MEAYDIRTKHLKNKTRFLSFVLDLAYFSNVGKHVVRHEDVAHNQKKLKVCE